MDVKLWSRDRWEVYCYVDGVNRQDLADWIKPYVTEGTSTEHSARLILGRMAIERKLQDELKEN